MSRTIKIAKKKKEKVPQRDTWTFQLPISGNRTVNVTVRQGQENVERKAKYIKGHRDYGGVLVPIFATLKDAKRQPVKTTVALQGVRISVEFPDGSILEARSCCKPPDVFNVRSGKRKATHRLFGIDSGIDPHTREKNETHKPLLTGEDRRTIYRAVLRNGKPVKERESEKSIAAK